MTIITNRNGLRQSLNQMIDQYLKKLLEPIDAIIYFVFNENEIVVLPDKLLPNSIMICNDIACEKEDNGKASIAMDRYTGIDYFYLPQSYAHIPKHLLREKINFFILLLQNEINIRHVYADHVNTDMTFLKFKEL